MCNDSASSLPKNVLPPNRIRCILINLHHSKLASATLAQTVLDLDIDVVLIQEPYAYSAEIPVVANIPPGFSAFHHLSNDHAYGSVILIKDSISTAGNLSVMHLSNFASCVELHTNRVRCVSLLSTFVPPSPTSPAPFNPSLMLFPRPTRFSA
jgi:hypothetical protein